MLKSFLTVKNNVDNLSPNYCTEKPTDGHISLKRGFSLIKHFYLYIHNV